MVPQKNKYFAADSSVLICIARNGSRTTMAQTRETKYHNRMKRDSHSHKGDNGKVAVVGGSAHMHGAPLFSALAAEAMGTDLVYVCLPACHKEVAKSQSLNFQVHAFAHNELSPEDKEPILELLATMDVAVLGPGIARTEESMRVLLDIIAESSCTLVLDATALQEHTLNTVRGKHVILTPHLGELERMGVTLETLQDSAKNAQATILLKGHTDTIASQDGTLTEVKGGNAGLTVGGTGDALAGCIAGLVAQGMDHVNACSTASTLIKHAGDTLAKEVGYSYTTADIIRRIPSLLFHDLSAV